MISISRRILNRFREGEWVDLLNSVTWLAVCAFLVYDVYASGDYHGLEWKIRNALKGVLYAVLLGVALWWCWEGMQEEGPGGAAGLL